MLVRKIIGLFATLNEMPYSPHAVGLPDDEEFAAATQFERRYETNIFGNQNMVCDNVDPECKTTPSSPKK